MRPLKVVNKVRRTIHCEHRCIYAYNGSNGFQVHCSTHQSSSGVLLNFVLARVSTMILGRQSRTLILFSLNGSTHHVYTLQCHAVPRKAGLRLPCTSVSKLRDSPLQIQCTSHTSSQCLLNERALTKTRANTRGHVHHALTMNR
jgi:hypothetical protein